MHLLNQSLVDEIADHCINSYKNLPKTGKPVDNEWTVLSCIVQYNTHSECLDVVSLGTGSKCIGATKMSSQGIVLNDSHAEVIARRGFLLFLYENILNAMENKQSIFIKEGFKYTLKDNIKFVLYSSQMPCGDASIVTKTEDVSNDIGDLIAHIKRKAENDACDIVSKKQKFDIHRTGAKCLTYNQQDPIENGQNYHLLGQVRTKPGRGDRTLSVSCSDKIARWIHCGINGSLLDMFLDEPVFIEHFIFGSGVPYSEETLHRALLLRESEVSVEDRLKLIPNFYKSTLTFTHVKSQTGRPAAGSILWVNTRNRLLEVAVQGKKLGVTKKKANDLNSSLSISKYNLFRKFLEVLHKSKELKEHICGVESPENIPYNVMKRKATQYQLVWRRTKDTFFKSWTIKPDMWNFCINTV